jgi:hypothetical protein
MIESIKNIFTKGNNKMEKTEQVLPNELKWLSDAPMFIDENQVNRFYDAIARPEYSEEKFTTALNDSQKTKINGKLKLEVEAEDPLSLLSTVFPFLPKGSADVGGSRENGTNQSNSTTYNVIHNAERKLEKLTFHYLIEETDRIQFVDNLAHETWRNPDSIKKVPRLLTFLDLPKEKPIIPTAAEFENGEIVLLYEKLLKKDGRTPPHYPEKATEEKFLEQQRKEYWQWFEADFSPTTAMLAVEEAASDNGKLRWIDYRLPLNNEGDTLHLHINPREEYDTGTFAYKFIKRGYKHGLRLVGTLKSEPDMNVLAIYEK